MRFSVATHASVDYCAIDHRQSNTRAFSRADRGNQLRVPADSADPPSEEAPRWHFEQSDL